MGKHGGARVGAGRKATVDKLATQKQYAIAKSASSRKSFGVFPKGPNGEESSDGLCPHGEWLALSSSWYAPSSKCQRCRTALAQRWTEQLDAEDAESGKI